MYNPTGCASLNDGGCPCPEGEVKCYTNAQHQQAGSEFFSEPWYGVCVDECCTDQQEACYDYETGGKQTCADIEAGGCPCAEGEVKCGADPDYNYAGYCTELCCQDDEELCYSSDYSYDYSYDYPQAESCAPIAAGGCPCAEEEVKCGAMPEYNIAGYCTELCCQDDEELCFSDDWYPQPESCALIEEGGCPCKDGEEKCGAMPEINYAGYCTSLCCEADQYTCYDLTSLLPTSCVAWDEECPTGVTFDVLKEKTMTMIDLSMMKHQNAKFNKFKALEVKMQAYENVNDKAIEKILQAEELAVLLKAKQSGTRKSFNRHTEVPAFMTKVY
eukprot:scaffold24800_cov44-Cyclotella_meneghiniana.AAC.2